MADKHGTGTAYNYGCRCEICMEHHRQRCSYFRNLRWSHRTIVDGRLVSTNPGLMHGTGNAYGNYGCRCEPCTRFNAERCSERRKNRASIIPRSTHG
jgi:hypothetical protein